jgi:8-oxo-dGTP diphosphatase
VSDARERFAGAKILLTCGNRLLTYQRDDLAHIPFPGMWDLPGGGREGQESPEACVLRELDEEFGLRLGAERLLWARAFPAMVPGAARQGWFFAGRITEAEIAAIRFGDEGQHWQMMGLARWLAHPGAVPELQRRVRIALAEAGL